MGIRLNKVLTELNIGLQTAVDFLKKKTSLGEIRDDTTPNTKISDEQYQALVQEFSGTELGDFCRGLVEKMAQRQQFKPLGKIDLGVVGKTKPAAAKSASPEESKPEPKAASESPAKK